MKILRSIGILALVAGLVLGGGGSALANGEPAEPPGGGSHSPKHGLFGTVASVATITGGYVISLDTEDWGTIDITANLTAKYMVPRETHGPKDLATFIDIVDEGEDGDLEELVDRRLAVLVTPLTVYDTPPPDFTATAIRLMLIPSPSSPPSWVHRVGVVEVFASPYTSITITDKDEIDHTFTVSEDTVYRPDTIAELTGAALEAALTNPDRCCVTVVTKGDPKLTPPLVAKAIVLHDDMPEWATP